MGCKKDITLPQEGDLPDVEEIKLTTMIAFSTSINLGS
jgi:hypothetical protein